MTLKTHVISIVLFLAAASLVAAERPKSLTVMLDGARADAVLGAKTPNIDALRDGTWAEGYKGAWTYAAHTINDAPTVSAPNHTAIATGASASKSRVLGNEFFADYNKLQASAAYKNYLSRIEIRHPEKSTVFLHGWPPSVLLMSENNRCDLCLQGTDEENVDRGAGILDGTFESDRWKRGSDVDALLFYVDLPDVVGHSGGFSPPGAKHDDYLRSIETCDAWIGRLLDAIRKRPKFADENWMVVICADHGGWDALHGPARAENRTVPLIMSAKSVVPGEMPGQPCTVDIAPTVLHHFGFDIDLMKEFDLLDGAVRGQSPARKEHAGSIDDGLLVYLPFDGNLDNKANAEIKVENHGCNLPAEGGKPGGYLAVRPGDKPRFVSLGSPEILRKIGNENFSVSFWLRMPGPQDRDPVFIGNKDWATGRNPGFCVFANASANNGNTIGFNIGNGTDYRIDVKQFFLPSGGWCFCAATLDRTGNATLYAGTPDGKLFFGSETLVGENVGSSGRLDGNIGTELPWNIGQDGTGDCGPQLNADIDELRIWNRCLDIKEVLALFRGEE